MKERKNVFSFELEIIIFFNTIDLTLSHQHINDNSALFNRQAWQALGDMSQTTAMVEFVKQLDALCPLFRPFTEAHNAEKQEQQRKRYLQYMWYMYLVVQYSVHGILCLKIKK